MSFAFMHPVGNLAAASTPPAAVTLGAPEYPARIAGLTRPPGTLWVRGRLPDPALRAAAIVGSRAASGKGCDRAGRLAGDLGNAGWAVVSGGAFGIDAAAHAAALDIDAPTFAVLGCGADIVYPDRHRALFERIAGSRSGGLLSQFPPGAKPMRRHFPARNRLIVALADVVIVVEAAARSGALITARMASRAGVPLLAVPGSAGTNDLIAVGSAIAIETADDVAAALAGRPRPLANSRGESAEVSVAIEQLRQALQGGPVEPDTVARTLGMPLASVMGLLGQAEIEGWVVRRAGSRYEACHG